ncbi:cobyrinate a,c-diamide synthase [Pendulispora albinea]|uniref:Cobyrinate a,c-diamide synthase n=1 Tax=Pendulispora albinea TaxID=2741071 RepID=A0ABZ2LYP7_9BACT
MASASFPRLVLAGTASGVGKTTVTIALTRALRARGLRVALFKCGPDYLDPTYHTRALEAPPPPSLESPPSSSYGASRSSHGSPPSYASQNLDGWMMGQEAVRTTFLHAARHADISLIEGVMGLYDGASPTGEEGSTAEIAKWLEAPVVLVVDAGGMARSIAALVGGFASFDPALRLGAAIANRVGSRGHVDLLRRALKTPPLLGGLPREPEHAFAERHLGLHTADERTLPTALLDHWGERAASWLSLDALLDLAESAPPLAVNVAVNAPASVKVSAPVSAPGGLAAADPVSVSAADPISVSGIRLTPASVRGAALASGPASSPAPVSASPRCRIGLARDEAFHFYYADNLRRLETLGAEMVPFSPIRDASLPDVDGLYFGGGYPEVHAAALSANAAMRAEIAAFAQRGAPIYAECGGLMYLAGAIVTLDGVRHPMVGLLPSEARMCSKLQALGYVEVETQTKTILGGPGTRFRGHQFRYSELSPELPPAVERVYSVRRRRGDDTLREGYRVRNVIASYVHAHWASNPKIAASLVESCAAYRRERAK